MNPLHQVAIAQVPAIIDFLKAVFKRKNPNAPEPTDEQVIAAYRLAFESSLAKDDIWLAAHPEN